jgi:RNA polymerase sigma-70 factor, ECF subfamily
MKQLNARWKAAKCQEPQALGLRKVGRERALFKVQPKEGLNPMTNELIACKRNPHEARAIENFLEDPNEISFTELFVIFTPQLIVFFRTRGCELALAEDLAQEVMMTVYCKATQLRDRTLFRAWLVKVARSVLCRHYCKQTREVETVDLADVVERLTAASHTPAATPAFEFMHWMAFLDSREQEIMRLRFIEQWEYHEIAAAQATPIGTVQWRVANAKKKLAPYLKTLHTQIHKAA